MDAPTARVFRIPSSLIYWGCAVPPHVPVDWPLRLDVIRKAVLGIAYYRKLYKTTLSGETSMEL
jgi:hypothetical protein